MNVLLFLVTIVVSLVVVRIGAVAFNLTGMEWTVAKFQAVSCFTGTGFTTRESELVVASPRRRRIATYLIIGGHAGFVAMIATFANSLRPNVFLSHFDLPFLRSVVPPGLLPWINLVISILAIYALFRFVPNTKLAKKVTALVKKKLVKKQIIIPESFEEVFVAPGGYGVSRVEVEKASPVLNKTLSEAGMRKQGITVLVIERGKKSIPNPAADTEILLGDVLLCFGKLTTMREEIYTLSGDAA